MMASSSSALNSVDYFVLFVFGISILAGYMRGLLKEVISVVTLVVASVVSTMFSSKLAAAFSGTGASASSAAGVDVSHPMSMVAIGSSFVALFIGTMFAGYLVSTLITGLAGSAGAGLSNRFLGALFGAIRGFLIVIVLMFIAELTPMGEQPAWGQSQFVKSFQPVVSWIEKMVHPGLEQVLKKTESAVQNATDSMQGATGVLGNMTGGQ